MGATNMLVEPVGLVGLDPNPKGTVLIGSGAERVRRRKRLLGKALLQARPRNAEKSYESANPISIDFWISPCRDVLILGEREF
ncbi:hypothetical protein ACMD2_06063 [Ananas comosus]|uniref:Uncharacterized protein n=1 Tax=Ananas comosus TaxID=4615 RepID=A0A199UKA6_ANACO|nr:hypothetical protein ACMD2_06063 [Ananas comosus]